MQCLLIPCVFLCKNTNVLLKYFSFSFSKVSTCGEYSFCGDYSAISHEIWMNGDWFHRTAYSNFGDDGKATKRSPPDNLPR